MIPVLLRELTHSWRSTALWSLAIVGILCLYLPLYPSLASGDMQQLLDALPPDLVATLGYDDITSGAGYTQATFFGLMGFFLVTAASVAWASQAIAGHEQSGRLELDLAHGIGRAAYVGGQSLALVIRVLILVAVGVATVLVLDGSAQLDLAPGAVIVAGSALAGLALFCGAWSLLAGAAIGGKALSAGVGALVAVLSYAFNALAAQNPDVQWLGDLSAYHWAFADDPLKGGTTLADQWPLWLFVVVFPLTAMVALRERDLRG
ncbi:ABC transporter permease subunit [Microbacterium sp. NPDC096154]|uniref:ABC transporter permease subunit n=1 Tax=Microbacterium sp. NPDC096154 TaxID=3155549 RepID=UPI00332F8D0A